MRLAPRGNRVSKPLLRLEANQPIVLSESLLEEMLAYLKDPVEFVAVKENWVGVRKPILGPSDSCNISLITEEADYFEGAPNVGTIENR